MPSAVRTDGRSATAPGAGQPAAPHGPDGLSNRARLYGIGHGGEISNPEALGFMLRAFFDTVRRHMAFEREHMFPPEWMQPVR